MTRLVILAKMMKMVLYFLDSSPTVIELDKIVTEINNAAFLDAYASQVTALALTHSLTHV